MGGCSRSFGRRMRRELRHVSRSSRGHDNPGGESARPANSASRRGWHAARIRTPSRSFLAAAARRSLDRQRLSLHQGRRHALPPRGRQPLLQTGGQGGQAARDPPPRPAPHPRHPGTASRHPSQGRLRASRACHRLDHTRHLLARHPGDAGRGGDADRGAGVRGGVAVPLGPQRHHRCAQESRVSLASYEDRMLGGGDPHLEDVADRTESRGGRTHGC